MLQPEHTPTHLLDQPGETACQGESLGGSAVNYKCFNDLKQFCALTDGNLIRHLGVLSDVGLVEVWKAHSGSRPQTLYRLTKSGRARFSEYLQLLERIVLDAQIHQQASPSRRPNSIGGVSPA